MGGSQTPTYGTEYGTKPTQPYSGCLSGAVLSYSLINLADQLMLSGKRHAGVVVRYVPSFLARGSAFWCLENTNPSVPGDHPPHCKTAERDPVPAGTSYHRPAQRTCNPCTRKSARNGSSLVPHQLQNIHAVQLPGNVTAIRLQQSGKQIHGGNGLSANASGNQTLVRRIPDNKRYANTSLKMLPLGPPERGIAGRSFRRASIVRQEDDDGILSKPSAFKASRMRPIPLSIAYTMAQ